MRRPRALRCGNSSCTAGEEAYWPLGTLAPGETQTITVNALVSGVLSGDLITLPVRLGADGLEDIMDQRKTVAVYNDPAADLALMLAAAEQYPLISQASTTTLGFSSSSSGTSISSAPDSRMMRRSG